MDKSEIRNLYRKRRAQVSLDERKDLSARALANLRAREDYKEARHIFAFASTDQEIDSLMAIQAFFEDGKEVYLPLTKKGRQDMVFSRIKSLEDLEPSNFGILEPKESLVDLVDPQLADLILVPGLAFDKRGYRVGYGGGFYDRFFANLGEGPVKLGYCYSWQVRERDLPNDEFDIAVDDIVTD